MMRTNLPQSTLPALLALLVMVVPLEALALDGPIRGALGPLLPFVASMFALIVLMLTVAAIMWRLGRHEQQGGY